MSYEEHDLSDDMKRVLSKIIPLSSKGLHETPFLSEAEDSVIRILNDLGNDSKAGYREYTKSLIDAGWVYKPYVEDTTDVLSDLQKLSSLGSRPGSAWDTARRAAEEIRRLRSELSDEQAD